MCYKKMYTVIVGNYGIHYLIHRFSKPAKSTFKHFEKNSKTVMQLHLKLGEKLKNASSGAFCCFHFRLKSIQRVINIHSLKLQLKILLSRF